MSRFRRLKMSHSEGTSLRSSWPPWRGGRGVPGCVGRLGLGEEALQLAVLAHAIAVALVVAGDTVGGLPRTGVSEFERGCVGRKLGALSLIPPHRSRPSRGNGEKAWKGYYESSR